MANPLLSFRLDKDADRLLQLIVATDGGDRADFARTALASAMSNWLNRKAEQVQVQLGTSPVIGSRHAAGEPAPSPAFELPEAA